MKIRHLKEVLKSDKEKLAIIEEKSQEAEERTAKAEAKEPSSRKPNYYYVLSHS